MASVRDRAEEFAKEHTQDGNVTKRLMFSVAYEVVHGRVGQMRSRGMGDTLVYYCLEGIEAAASEEMAAMRYSDEQDKWEAQTYGG
jgi:hypothetical protein